MLCVENEKNEINFVRFVPPLCKNARLLGNIWSVETKYYVLEKAVICAKLEKLGKYCFLLCFGLILVALLTSLAYLMLNFVQNFTVQVSISGPASGVEDARVRIRVSVILCTYATLAFTNLSHTPIICRSPLTLISG